MSDSPAPPACYDDLRALFLNCTLKPSGVASHTERLIHVAAGVMEANGVGVEIVRPVDLDLAPGMQPDMTGHGFEHDDWPGLCRKVMGADILVLCTPIWLGEESSVCRRVIERLYAESGKLNDKGQYIYYGRVGGCLVTGNEDGIKHCAMTITRSRHRQTPAGSAKPAPARHTGTTAPASTTISPSATPPSWPGT